MAQIYDHRPRGGNIDLSTSGERAAAGLASWYREQQNRKEAGRREAAFQQDQERSATEQQIMDMRLEEAQRQYGEAQAVRETERAFLSADIEDPQGRWHAIVQERLGPKQGAALERMRADKRVPPEAISRWLDDQGDRFRMQDTIESLRRFSDRAQRVLAHTAGEGDSSPIENEVGVLVESIRSDPSAENLGRVTNELHKLEADFNFEQEAYDTWDDAQALFKELKAAEDAVVPMPGEPYYEEYRKVVNAIRSSERWRQDKGGARHITDYNALLEDADAYLHPFKERRAEQRILARLKEQQMMRQDNPDLYRRLDAEGTGLVPKREFALAQAEEAEAASYRGAPGVPAPEQTEAPVAPSEVVPLKALKKSNPAQLQQAMASILEAAKTEAPRGVSAAEVKKWFVEKAAELGVKASYAEISKHLNFKEQKSYVPPEEAPPLRKAYNEYYERRKKSGKGGTGGSGDQEGT